MNISKSFSAIFLGLILVPVFLMVGNVFSQPVVEEWAARYHGPATVNAYDHAHDLPIDASGNVYVTGYSTGISTKTHYATIKYDSDGNELWVARYNGTGDGDGDDEAQALAVDSLGNVYVTGWSSGVNSPRFWGSLTFRLRS
jgi:hypothetical protein